MHNHQYQQLGGRYNNSANLRSCFRQRVLSGLPPTGTWILTRSPGGVTTNGTGTSTNHIRDCSWNIYLHTVTSALGCISNSSANVVINAVPSAPSAPLVGAIISLPAPLATGSVVLSGLPSSGNWILTRSPGAQQLTEPGQVLPYPGLCQDL